MDSMIGLDHSMGSVITTGWAGSQAVLPDQLVLLAGFHAEVGLFGRTGPLAMFCDQTGLKGVL